MRFRVTGAVECWGPRQAEVGRHNGTPALLPAATISQSHSQTLLLNLAKVLTEMERCIESLIAVFQKYSGKDGNSCQLSKTELCSFMNTELATFMKNQKDPGVLDHMMKKVDLNSDEQLDFQEFLNFIGCIAIACHESFLQTFQKHI
ncbi:protein S100-A11-like [Apodemus sylvaticus]|uniref:protein S100-A11-like n=1 Tax=Apodemus sylvaticus TaxID=10129 RepID=UPI002242FC23|nr:protein S100-A11-like [Apodemus sylvaticus]